MGSGAADPVSDRERQLRRGRTRRSDSRTRRLSDGASIPAPLLQRTSLDKGTELFAFVDPETETLTYVDSQSPWECDVGESLGTYTIHDVDNSRGVSIPADVVEAGLVSTDDDLLASWDHDTRQLTCRPGETEKFFHRT
ncbi:MAG: hypothetical protein V5A28_05415 [Haloarculaceae archaeon]